MINRIFSGLLREKQDLKRLLKEDAEEVTQGVPLHTLQVNIDESLKNLREKLLKRHEEIEVLLSEQKDLCTSKLNYYRRKLFLIQTLVLDLEEPERPLESDPLPSEQEMQDFREYLYQLNTELHTRFDRISEMRSEIRELMEKLELTTLNERDNNLLNSVDIKPTLLSIEKLEQLKDVLVSQYDKMKHQIEDMQKRLAQLWKYLEIPDSHQRRFAKYTEITLTNYDKLIAEVQRCDQIKKENIRNFIEKVREEIEVYWEKCLKSNAERLRFPSFTANTFNEDVLELHEDELRDLKSFYEDNEEIFNMIKDRQDLWNQMELLVNKEADPKRYNNRGGQLLKEEKERKMISMKLPKIEAKLIEMVETFEANNNRNFTMFGVRIQDIIERDYEVKRQEKLTKSGKKTQATPARTPGRNMTTRTPLTIEQTIINRTAMKTTGGRLRVVAQTRQAMSTTSSSTTSSVRSVRTDTGKRRMVPPKAGQPQAKRQLLGAFASPANVLRQVNGNASNVVRKAPTMKNTSMKVYNVGSCIKRRSRKSGGKNRRSSILRKNKQIPNIVLASPEGTATTTDRETTSYEGFEVRILHFKYLSV